MLSPILLSIWGKIIGFAKKRSTFTIRSSYR
jgi:hypothetical protein